MGCCQSSAAKEIKTIDKMWFYPVRLSELQKHRIPKDILKQRPLCTNYLVMKSRESPNYVVNFQLSSFNKTALTIREHMKIDNVTTSCVIGLNRHQFLRIFKRVPSAKELI